MQQLYSSTMKRSKPAPQLDLSPYAGRWVALVRGHVAGVGWTAEEARRAAQHSRPKEQPELLFVPEIRTTDGDRPAP